MNMSLRQSLWKRHCSMVQLTNTWLCWLPHRCQAPWHPMVTQMTKSLTLTSTTQLKTEPCRVLTPSICRMCRRPGNPPQIPIRPQTRGLRARQDMKEVPGPGHVDWGKKTQRPRHVPGILPKGGCLYSAPDGCSPWEYEHKAGMASTYLWKTENLSFYVKSPDFQK